MRKASERTRAHAIFSLVNLGCASCPNIIERKLRTFEGIKKVAVNYVTDTLLLDYDPKTVTIDAIRAHITKLGQTAA
jgi:copper chaperone CopZ